MKTLFFCFLLFFVSLSHPNLAKGEGIDVAGASGLPKQRLEKEVPDPRIIKLAGFLKSQNSPLAPYAADFLAAADKYHLEEFGLTYLVPAITGLESGFGRFYLAGSFNAYGWAGGYYLFNSWEESIEHVTRVLRQKYLDRGAITIAKIGPIYAESPAWSARVRAIMKKIEAFQSSATPSFTL